ncbi:hydroxyacid dehydrogenase [Phytoactinopolyspora halotolerans]|uniref:Hydroxyacid dehydrogenase n=1 Tax=Phytoactinopolyspora halotolerans TaxID=1981512 RepID=A0A6L9SFV4_9ACTN|nr:hydroxyacid dehydrogenase [Phytoactinopolyspora halotolerans]NEE02960.1 hydroxyacid dehydrogenase [Phytoactinopolyspora halotolerans]
MDDRTFELQFREPQLRRVRSLVELGEPMRADDLDSPEVRQRLQEVEVLLTSWGCPELTEERLAGMPGLRAVFHCAGSVRSFVTDAVWRRHLLVTNAADENAIPVAEFTFAAVVFAGKKVPFLGSEAREHRGAWEFVRFREDLSNRGRVVGVVGFSRVGQRVVERLRSLDVEILVADPYADKSAVADAGARLVELPELLQACDVLTLHVPELPTTRHLIGAEELALLRDGATVINTARGSVIDTAALTRECAYRRLYAMLDVTDPDPLPADSPLFDLPNVLITPHVAGSLGSEAQRMSDSALDELERYVTGRPPRAAVTPDELAVSA